MILYHVVRSNGLSIESLGTTYSLEAAKKKQLERIFIIITIC